MNVCVVLDQRFARLPDGTVWTQNQCGTSFWRRYLDVFDHVRCLARLRDVDRLDGVWDRADGPGVSFSAVPYYVGPHEFLRQARQVRGVIRASMLPGEAFVFRVPGHVSDMAWRKLAAMGYPYAVEVVGDPYDGFAPGAVQHPLRVLFRWQATRLMKKQCAGASTASYVTADALQRRYPSSGAVIAASSIELEDHAFVSQPRVFSASRGRRNIVFVGTLEQYYKAPDLLIRAFAESLKRGADLQLTLIGTGKHRSDLEALAAECGCGQRIRFAGNVAAGAGVRAELDEADIFVLPSRAEGLPRAMIEAMARALPCIGSDVGGIPELLSADAMVPAGDVPALAEKMLTLAHDAERLTRLSATNLERARVYRSGVLQERRVGFYRGIREATEDWLRDAGTGGPA